MEREPDTVILARPLVCIARPQTQEPSTDETSIRDKRQRAEPVDVPDAAQEVRPDGKTQADDETGSDGEHDRDGTTTGETVAFDVFKVLAVYGGSEDGDGELDREFAGFADVGRVAACAKGTPQFHTTVHESEDGVFG